MSKKTRLDILLVERGLQESRQKAQATIMSGLVFVNGQLQEEPYISEPTHLAGDMTFPVTVPPGCYFVLGDNRNHSQDSRSAALGFVPREDIEGKAVFRFAPFSAFGPIR